MSKFSFKKTLLAAGLAGCLLTCNAFAVDTVNVKVVCDSDISLKSGDVFYVSYQTDSGEVQKFKLDASQIVDSGGSIAVDSIRSISDLEYAGSDKDLKDTPCDAFFISADTDKENSGSGSGVEETNDTVCIAIGSQSVSTVKSEVKAQNAEKKADQKNNENTKENNGNIFIRFFKSVFSMIDFSGFFRVVGRNALIIGGILVIGLLIAWILKLTGRIF